MSKLKILVLLTSFLSFFLWSPTPAQAVNCGGVVPAGQGNQCPAFCPGNPYRKVDSTVEVCCGYPFEGLCYTPPCVVGEVFTQGSCSCSQMQVTDAGTVCLDAADPVNFSGCLRMEFVRDETGKVVEYSCAEELPAEEPPIQPPIQPPTQPGQPVTDETFDSLNPIKITTSDPELAQELSSPAGFLNRVMQFAFPISGLLLFLMIVWGGFEMLSGATTQKSIEQGKNRIVAALIGFLLLFVAYWIMTIVETIFGVKIL